MPYGSDGGTPCDEGELLFNEAPTLPLGRHALPDGERPLILVADDSDDAQLLYTSCFESLGYRVRSTGTGVATIQIARSALPEIIIMDLAMPDIDGIEATRRIKEDPRTRGSAVIVVTAQGSAAFPAARAAGCDAFFCKPLDPYALDDVIRTLLPEGHPSALAPTPIDPNHVFKRCGCGRAYLGTEWNDLPLRGYMGGSSKGPLLEIRNCVCGSTIAVSAEWLGSAERLVRH